MSEETQAGSELSGGLGRLLKRGLHNAFTICFLPVVFAGVLWAAFREAWEMGSEASGILADWFNKK